MAASGGNARAVEPVVQPIDRLQASVSANYTPASTSRSGSRTRTPTATASLDHVYGTLDRNVVDITSATTYAFNRDLTLQAYLQPFVAVGDYADIRRLARPRSFEFEPVAIAYNPDFNTKSLRGNIVLRWEYMRGSTLFVVWDMSQADYARPGQFSLFRDLGDTFGADATNVLMVKASYWFNR